MHATMDTHCSTSAVLPLMKEPTNSKNNGGARSEPLYWHDVLLKSNSLENESNNSSKYNKAIQFWQKLPVNITKLIGPMIRKNIGL